MKKAVKTLTQLCKVLTANDDLHKINFHLESANCKTKQNIELKSHKNSNFAEISHFEYREDENCLKQTFVCIFTFLCTFCAYLQFRYIHG